MSKRRKWKCLAAFFLLLCVALVAGFWGREDKLRYKGYGLEDWVSSAYHPEGALAVHTIVTNNLEAVARMIEYDERDYKKQRALALKVPRWLLRSGLIDPLIPEFYQKKREQMRAATIAFWIVGTNAAGAVPTLKSVLLSSKSEASMHNASYALTCLGPAGKEALFSVITGTNTSARTTALEVYTMTSGPTPEAIRLVEAALHDTDPAVRKAATNLYRLYINPPGIPPNNGGPK